MKPLYTPADLTANSKAYEANFKKLLACKLGSKEHDKYATIEGELNRKEIHIRSFMVGK